MNLHCLIFGHDPEKVDEAYVCPVVVQYECQRCGKTGSREETTTLGDAPPIDWSSKEHPAFR